MFYSKKLMYRISVADPDPFVSVSFYQIRIRDPFLSVLGSGFVSYSDVQNKINWKGKMILKNAFWLGPGRPIDNENQIKMYKKYRYCFRYITSVKR